MNGAGRGGVRRREDADKSLRRPPDLPPGLYEMQSPWAAF